MSNVINGTKQIGTIENVNSETCGVVECYLRGKTGIC
jgi:hypothetical protein